MVACGSYDGEACRVVEIFDLKRLQYATEPPIAKVLEHNFAYGMIQRIGADRLIDRPIGPLQFGQQIAILEADHLYRG
jgi:hypothetical protein